MAENHDIKDGIAFEDIEREEPKDFNFKEPVFDSLPSVHESQTRNQD